MIVAVIDTGFDIDHPDLKPNLWVNPGEVPGDGIDNDGNGEICTSAGTGTASPDWAGPVGGQAVRTGAETDRTTVSNPGTRQHVHPPP